MKGKREEGEGKEEREGERDRLCVWEMVILDLIWSVSVLWKKKLFY